MVISDYQIETVSGRSPGTNTLVRIPAPDYIIKDKLGDYALDRAQKVIDGFSEVRSLCNFQRTDSPNNLKFLTSNAELRRVFSISISTIPNPSLKVVQRLIKLGFQTLLQVLWKTGV